MINKTSHLLYRLMCSGSHLPQEEDVTNVHLFLYLLQLHFTTYDVYFSILWPRKAENKICIYNDETFFLV